MKTIIRIITPVILLISFLILIMPTIVYGKTINVNNPEESSGYTKIQDAIDNATDGDIIIVYNGKYFENLTINKSITLKGIDRNNTIINSRDKNDAIKITNTKDVEISNLTITAGNLTEYKNGSWLKIIVFSGVEIDNVTDSVIKYCNISNCSAYGISFVNSDNITKNVNINNNMISNNRLDAIEMRNCEEITVYKNNISKNKANGITLLSNNNKIINNTFYANGDIGLYIPPSSKKIEGNIIYQNVFINNIENAQDTSNGGNFWYNDDLKKGNYWDDYTGNDNNGDKIGDSAYNIPGGDNKDLYPMMIPYGGEYNYEFVVDQGSVIIMLIFGMFICIIFCIPIGLWWRKKYFK